MKRVGGSASDRLGRALAAVRRRWRTRRTLEAAAVFLALLLLAGTAAIAAMDGSRFDPEVVRLMRVAFYAVCGLGVAAALLRIATRSPDRVVARYVESAVPGLDALVESAVDVAGRRDPGVSTSLLERLLVRAAAACRAPPAVGIEGHRMRRAAAGLLLAAALGAVGLALAPAGYRHGAGLLLAPRTPAEAGNPYTIGVLPGDVSVLAGTDVRVAAAPRGFAPAELILSTRSSGAGGWEPLPMTMTEDGGFEALLLELGADTEYRVDGGGVHSSVHRVTVVPRPEVRRIDLVFHFPERTGRPPERVEGGGEIRAVRGTRVELRVVPSRPAPEGQLVVEGAGETRALDLRPIEADAEGALHGEIAVAQSGYYRIDLPAADGTVVAASPAFAIVAFDDALPEIELLRPGRDARVTSVEEIEIAVRAGDDVAVRSLELVLSVNGGAEEVIDLSGPGPRTSVREQVVMYLEERGLAPGDLLAYYARAADAPDPTRTVYTDVFFMDVRPFGRRYRASSAGGGGGGGGGAGRRQGEETLTAQQRSVVVALFNIARDRLGLEPEALAEAVATVRNAQSRVRERVDAIARRLGTRSIVEASPAHQEMARAFPKAARAMLEVEALLSVRDVDAALPSARTALHHLAQADAALRDVQVRQARNAGGGGQQAANDLTNLFRLEMDRFRNPYDDVRRGRWEAREERLDATVDKLRELARRQQQELERAGRRGERGEGGGQASQAALAAAVEELERRLARLTRERDSEALRRAREELDRAADAMRRFASGEDPAAGGEALERLREAARALDADRPTRLADAVGDALGRAEAAAREQHAIMGDLQRAVRATPDRPEVGELGERKGALADSVRSLEGDLERLAAQSEGEQREASGALGEAAADLREGDVAGEIERSRRSLVSDPSAHAAQGEAGIARALERVRERIAAARDLVREPGQARLARALERMRSVMRRVEAGGERLRERMMRGSQRSAANGRAGGPGGAMGGGRAGGSAARGGGRAGPGGAMGGGGGVGGVREFTDIAGDLGRGIRELGGVADAIADNPGAPGDLEALVRAIRAAAEAGVPGADPQALAERHAELLAALQALEPALRRAAGEDDPQLVAGGLRREPAPEHRALVEEYYRNLSESAGAARP